jgi:sterol desaturase/sphingolipid hydroxylase (fatty acid hydroxylase superfamily)
VCSSDLILAGIISHTGYEALLIKGKRVIELGYFFHQLHHRFFDCNYGTGDMPWDKWFSTFHNGTTEATQALRKKQAAQRLRKKKYLAAD